jgi:hypothetical protein
VVNGPATVSLKKYNATIDGNIITITAWYFDNNLFISKE